MQHMDNNRQGQHEDQKPSANYHGARDEEQNGRGDLRPGQAQTKKVGQPGFGECVCDGWGEREVQ